MSPETKEEYVGRAALSALDPGLPYLASQAAIEVDNLLLGKPPHLDSVKQLAERLTKSTTVLDGTSKRQTLMDPPTVTIVSDAISSLEPQKLQSMAELAREALSIAAQLTKTTASEEKQILERLRRFCVALSRSAASYQQSTYEIRSTHPDRR